MLRHLIPGVLATLCFPLATLSAQGSIAGTVTDSMHRHPLAGALVQIVADSSRFAKSATSDSLGKFRIDSVRAWLVHHRLFPLRRSTASASTSRRGGSSLGQASSSASISSIPSAWTVETQLCRGTPMLDSTGLLLGHVRDADTQQPRIGTVTVFWRSSHRTRRSQTQRQQIPMKTDAWAGSPSAGSRPTPSSAPSASAGDEESGVGRDSRAGWRTVDARLSRESRRLDGLGLRRQRHDTNGRCALPVATLRRGSARLSGVVRNDKGKPVANASVSVPGTGVEVRTQEYGRVHSVANLPAGTQTVEVRVIGFEPKRVHGRSRTRSPNDARRHARPAGTDARRGEGLRHGQLAYGGIPATRQSAGWGHILTPADIEKRHAFKTIRSLPDDPGVRVAPRRLRQTSFCCAATAVPRCT